MNEQARQFDPEQSTLANKAEIFAHRQKLLENFDDVSSLPSIEFFQNISLLTTPDKPTKIPKPDKESTDILRKRIARLSLPILEICTGSDEKTTIENNWGQKQVIDLLEKMIEKKSQTKSDIDKIKKWVEEDPEERIEFVENFLSQLLQNSSDINFYILTLLSEINASKTKLYVSEQFAIKMEVNQGALNKELLDQIALLNRTNDPNLNFILHKILDFLQQYVFTIQNHIERKIETEMGEYYGGLYQELVTFISTELKHSKNYLVKKHFQDIADMFDGVFTEKEGAILGSSLGASDNIIYGFSHIAEADKNRQALGIKEGYPAANPALPIAKGYIGLYEAGRVRAVYKEEDKNPDTSLAQEQEYIENNNPDYDYIYDEINKKSREAIRNPANYHWSYELWKVQSIKLFIQRIQQNKEKFYFDLSKVDLSEIHPLVLAEIITHNQRYRNEKTYNITTAEAIKPEDYKKLLFPLGNYSAEKEYNYNYLTSLAMRKRIEDDFGFKIEEFSLWEQRMFLSFVEKIDEQDADKLKQFLSQTPDEDEKRNKIIVFLSLEEDETMSENIFLINEQLSPETTSTIFAKYASLVAIAEQAGEYLKNKFLDNKECDNEAVKKFSQNLLKKANGLLKKYAEKIKAGDTIDENEILEQLEQEKNDVIFFTTAFRTVFKGEKQIDFAEVKNLEFTRQAIEALSDAEDGEKEQMLNIAKKNWLPQGKLGKKVVEDFASTLKYGNEIDFYILKKEGKIVAFVRFDKPTKDGHRYAGSFNVDPDYRGSAIGEAVIQNALQKEAKQYVLEATVYPQIPVGTKYIEEVGFSITGVIHNYDNSGKTFFEITCDLEANKNQISRQGTQEQLISQYFNNNWQEQIGHNLIVLNFDPDTENDAVIKATEELIKAGYIGSRYFTDPQNKTKRYYVFELKKEQ